jgi:hypothetical protein
MGYLDSEIPRANDHDAEKRRVGREGSLFRQRYRVSMSQEVEEVLK